MPKATHKSKRSRKTVPAEHLWQAIGKRLMAIRGAFYLEIEDAARIAGVSPRSWRKWETGPKGPRSMLPISRLCRSLGVSLDWIYSGKTVEERRATLQGPLAMDAIAGLRARHRAYVDGLVAKARA